MKQNSLILFKSIPTLIAFGIGFLGYKLIRNEKKLLSRKLELEESINSPKL